MPRGSHPPTGEGGVTASRLHTCFALLPPPAGLLPVAWLVQRSSFIFTLPWFSRLGEADRPEVSILHCWLPLGPTAKFLSACLRLTIFSNPEQIRRCGQGREAHHQLSSQPPWKRGAPEIRQPLGPSGLYSPPGALMNLVLSAWPGCIAAFDSHLLWQCRLWQLNSRLSGMCPHTSQPSRNWLKWKLSLASESLSALNL